MEMTKGGMWVQYQKARGDVNKGGSLWKSSRTGFSSFAGGGREALEGHTLV
jgi:hypothetical protein